MVIAGRTYKEKALKEFVIEWREDNNISFEDDTKRPVFRVQQLDHVELFVPDQYEAASWYEQVLGLRIAREFEGWAADGPLMLVTAEGDTKLALFAGTPRPSREAANFHRIAFRVNGDAFLEFVKRLNNCPLYGADGKRVGRGDVVDHELAYSIYFNDPYGHPYEVTTYDYEWVSKRLKEGGPGLVP